MLDEAAALAINLLPVIAEQAQLRPPTCVKEPCLDRIHEAGISVLVLVDEQDWITRGHNRTELRIGKGLDHQCQYVIMSKRHLMIPHAWIS